MDANPLKLSPKVMEQGKAALPTWAVPQQDMRTPQAQVKPANAVEAVKGNMNQRELMKQVGPE